MQRVVGAAELFNGTIIPRMSPHHFRIFLKRHFNRADYRYSSPIDRHKDRNV